MQQLFYFILFIFCRDLFSVDIAKYHDYDVILLTVRHLNVSFHLRNYVFNMIVKPHVSDQLTLLEKKYLI